MAILLSPVYSCSQCGELASWLRRKQLYFANSARQPFGIDTAIDLDDNCTYGCDIHMPENAVHIACQPECGRVFLPACACVRS